MKKRTNKTHKLLKKYNQGIKVDLGCGPHKQPDFVGIDMTDQPGVDIVHDLEVFPWPLPDECANLVMAGHIIEHINPAKGTFIKFMDEAWRILKPDGQMMISTPYANSMGLWADPTHVRGYTEYTWRYFDPLHSSKVYNIYKPKPWKVQNLFFRKDGNMEVLLVKRRIDKSYGA